MLSMRWLFVFICLSTLWGCMGSSSKNLLDPKDAVIEGCVVETEFVGGFWNGDQYVLVCSDGKNINDAVPYRFGKLVLTESVNTESIVLGNFISLKDIVIENANIKHLDLTTIGGLTVLDVRSESLQSIVTRSKLRIAEFYLSGVKSLISIEFSKAAIEGLYLSGELHPAFPLDSLLSHAEITSLSLASESIHLGSVDLSHMRGLKNFEVAKADIQHLDLSKNPELFRVTLKSEYLQSISFPEYNATTWLHLTLENLKSLGELVIVGDRISELTVNGPTYSGVNINSLLASSKISHLDLQSVPLADIDWSLGVNLEYLSLSKYDVIDSDFASLPSATRLVLFGDNPVSVDLSKAGMSEVELAYSSVNDILLPENRSIYLDVRAHETAELKVSGVGTIADLSLYNESGFSTLSSLDVSDLSGLSALSVSVGGMKELDLSKNEFLKELKIYSMPLENLLVAKPKLLSSLQLYGTKLSCDQLQTLFLQTRHWAQVALSNECS